MTESPFNGARETSNAHGKSAGVQQGDISIISVCGETARITVIGNENGNTIIRKAWNYIDGTMTPEGITGSVDYNGTSFAFTITKGNNDILCVLREKGKTAESDDGDWQGVDQR